MRIARWVVLAGLVAGLAAGVATMPTYASCMGRDGNWWKPLGKIHCELEAWRSLFR